MKILLVEDDKQTADYIAKGLREHGHVVDHADNGRDGLYLATGEKYDVMIVDRMLPAMDGLSLVKAARASNVRTPVLFLTTMGGIDDRVTGLEAGGDDYLVKPFAFAELLARVGALARRPPIVAATSLSAGDLEMDLLARTVTRAGKRIELLAQEFKILEYLLRHAGEVVTRTMLLEKVWDFHFDPKTNIVETHISRLRSKIDKGFDKPLLHTVRGAGYVIRAPDYTRILRSASFRLPLIYAVLFVLSAGALFATVYWTATAAMQNDMAAVLRTEAYQLAEIHQPQRPAGPCRADHAAHELPHPRADLLPAAGAQPPGRGRQPARHAAGQRRRRLRAPDRHARSPRPSASKLTGFGLTLSDGSFLLVAQDADRLTDMQHAIVRAFAWAGGLTLLLAIAGGALLGTSLPAPHRHHHAHQPRHHGGRSVGAHSRARHARRDRPARRRASTPCWAASSS